MHAPAQRHGLRRGFQIIPPIPRRVRRNLASPLELARCKAIQTDGPDPRIVRYIEPHRHPLPDRHRQHRQQMVVNMFADQIHSAWRAHSLHHGQVYRPCALAILESMRETPVPTPQELARIDAYFRAANYLSVGQIYLRGNPLLQKPLTPTHIKPRLLGRWGTTPGLNFIYAHANRVINKYDLNMIYIAGPGHGGPALVANTYLEGSYTETYPNIFLS